MINNQELTDNKIMDDIEGEFFSIFMIEKGMYHQYWFIVCYIYIFMDSNQILR
jgi:hypothetical protein